MAYRVRLGHRQRYSLRYSSKQTKTNPSPQVKTDSGATESRGQRTRAIERAGRGRELTGDSGRVPAQRRHPGGGAGRGDGSARRAAAEGREGGGWRRRTGGGRARRRLFRGLKSGSACVRPPAPPRFFRRRRVGTPTVWTPPWLDFCHVEA